MKTQVSFKIVLATTTLALASSGCLKVGKDKPAPQPQKPLFSDTVELVTYRASDKTVEISLARSEVPAPPVAAGELAPKDFSEKLLYEKDEFGQLKYSPTTSVNNLGLYQARCQDASCRVLDITIGRDGASKAAEEQSVLHIERVANLSCVMSSTLNGGTVKSEYSLPEATLTKMAGLPRVAVYAHVGPIFDVPTDTNHETFLRNTLTSASKLRVNNISSPTGQAPVMSVVEANVTKANWDTRLKIFDLDAIAANQAKIELRCKY